MLVEVLLALESVPANRDAMVGGVEDVRVIELAHRFELCQDPPDLDIDVLAASEVATELVADRALVSILPDAADLRLIALVGQVRCLKRMGGSVIWWTLG